jgi:hypothetical protein
MKPWQLAKMMRVLKVRANLVLIFSLQNHYRFLVLDWSQLDVLDTHGCIPKRQAIVMEIIGLLSLLVELEEVLLRCLLSLL